MMRHPAIPLLVAPALALALAACEPVPTQPELPPLIAPVGVGVGLPPPGAVRVTPVSAQTAGTFSPDPVSGPPIIEEVLTDRPGELITPPSAAPLSPSISRAVDAVGGPPPAGSDVITPPLGATPGTSPFGAVPGGPLPEPRFQGSSLGAQSPDGPAGTAPPAPDARIASSAAATGAATGLAPIPASASAPRARGISDEQDFAAVSLRESIESDAERLARLRAERLEFAPEPVPGRPAQAVPNIVAFAIAAPNALGQPLYRRSGLRQAARLGDACARFASDDRAQEAFLAAGGPERDRHGLDPDGDGFACGWDPRPFRRPLP